jgi:hypothetical protein
VRGGDGWGDFRTSTRGVCSAAFFATGAASVSERATAADAAPRDEADRFGTDAAGLFVTGDEVVAGDGAGLCGDGRAVWLALAGDGAETGDGAAGRVLAAAGRAGPEVIL